MLFEGKTGAAFSGKLVFTGILPGMVPGNAVHDYIKSSLENFVLITG